MLEPSCKPMMESLNSQLSLFKILIYLKRGKGMEWDGGCVLR